MLVRAPYIISFILAVCCWFKHNAAIPLASHSSITNKMQDAFKKTVSQNNWDDMRSRATSEESSDVIDSNSAETIQNMINNQNMNMNMNIFGRGVRHRNVRPRDERHRDKYRKQGTKESSILTYKSLDEITKEQLANCSSGKKKNQRYSSSFIGNAATTSRSLSIEKEFNEVVGNKSKTKTTSSVHEDEDITLCWIETTTIKEDKTVQPPKRLVIREYTISFENSAIIPDRYLECKRLEGELMANDPEICNTALFEVIDEDTRVSRVVNFTSVGHVGDIIVWQHKMVKCGVGPVVSKNIVEWNDGSKNPKKRVEIKVSPKMYQLKSEEEEPCMESSEDEEIEDSSTRIDATTESCETESGICEVTTKSAAIPTKHGDDVGTTEDIATELSSSEVSGENESEEDLSLSTGIRKPVSEEILGSTIAPTTSTTIPEKTDILNCKEDPSNLACIIQKNGTPSSEEFSTELSTTLIPTDGREMITEEETSSEERLSVTTEPSSKSSEEKETISDLTSEETTLFTPTTDISRESSEEHTLKPTDKAFVTDFEDVDTVTQMKTTTSRSATEDKKQEKTSTSEEISGDNFVESTSEELDKVDHIPFSSTTASGEVDTEHDVTSAVGFTEFARESEKPGKILDKLSPVSAESTNESITIGPSSTFEEISSEESGESVTSGIEEATTFPPRIELSPTTSGELDYSCEESEDCIYVSGSEACDESGNCGRTTTRSCESGECSEEEDQSRSDATLPSITTKIRPSGKPVTNEIQRTTVANTAPTMLTAREAENISTVINTMESRRSTTTSRPRHKLTLKVKVLLEHVNEKKEKHNLVEVERHLSLDEDPEHQDHPVLLEQLKSLNDSVNMETVDALLNCTSLGSLTRHPNFIGRQSNDINDSYEGLEFNSEYEDSISEQSISEHVDAKNEEPQYSEYDQAAFRKRRRRSVDDKTEDPEIVRLLIPFNPLSTLEPQDVNLTTPNVQPFTTTNNPEEETSDQILTENEKSITMEKDESTTPSVKDTVATESEKSTTTEKDESTIPSIKKNVNNETKMEVMRQTLPGIQKDIMVGLQHMVSQLAQNNLTSISNIKEMAKMDLLDIIADPKNSRIRSRRRRATAEEVGHWSNERIRKAPMGGNLRSFTEFTLYKVLP